MKVIFSPRGMDLVVPENKQETYRVVVVDDESECREWIRSMLEASEEFQVVGEARTGVEAINLAATETPDLVIADIYMPDLDGFDVTRHIKRQYTKIEVILVSATDAPIYSKLAREEEAAAFIPKSRLSRESLLLALQAAD